MTPLLRPPPQQPLWYTFSPVPQGTDFSRAAIDATLIYPGVKLSRNGQTIGTPLNAAWLVEAALRATGQDFKVHTTYVIPRKWPQSLDDIKELRKTDPKTGIAMSDFINAYQQRETFRTMTTPGVLFRWPTGAGKSLGSMVWTLAQPGQIVVVTGAKGRVHWRNQIERFTTASSYTIVGTGSYDEHEFELDGEYPYKDVGRAISLWEATHLNSNGTATCSCGVAHRIKTVRRKVSGSLKTSRYGMVASVTLGEGRHRLSFTSETVSIQRTAIPRDARFVIVGWEILPYHVEQLCALKPSAVVLDESHRSKNHRHVMIVPISEADLDSEPKAKQLEDGRWVKFVSLENIAASTGKLCTISQRRLLLTATLVKDRIRDAWAQLHYMMPWAWGPYWPWARRYAGAVQSTYGMFDKGCTNLNELAQRIAFHDSYVTREESNANLPPIRREIVYLPPEAQQLEDRGFANELMSAVPATITSIKLAAACSRKRKALCEKIVEAANSGSKVCVFTARHNDVDVLSTVLKQQLSKNVRLFAIDGRTPVDKRATVVAEYMALRTHAVLVATGYALGEQIDLNETDLAMIAMLPLTPADIVQWEGRFMRQGSTRACLIQYWVAEGTVDERMVSILLDKLPAVERIGTEGVQGIARAFKGDEAALLAELAQSIIVAAQPDDRPEIGEERP